MSKENDYKKALDDIEVNSGSNIASSKGGYHPINMNLLGYKGKYYPKNTEISVKPFSVDEVVYFTSINENNPLEVDRAMGYLIDNCVKVTVNGRSVKSSDIIFNYDRFTIILLARTYSDMRTDLTFEHKCDQGSCKHEQTLKIIPQNIVYTDNKLDGVYDDGDGIFSIKKRDSDIVYGYLPVTINENKELFNYLIEKREELSESKLKTFVKIFPFMRNHVEGAKNMDDVYHKFLDLSKEVITDLSTLADNFDLNTKQMISSKCGGCGYEGDIPMRFPNGIKSVVLDKAKIDDFIL